ncbi:hypothetical protein KXR94_21125 [Stutzerimonas stutzeri]
MAFEQRRSQDAALENSAKRMAERRQQAMRRRISSELVGQLAGQWDQEGLVGDLASAVGYDGQILRALQEVVRVRQECLHSVSYKMSARCQVPDILRFIDWGLGDLFTANGALVGRNINF